MSGFGETIRIGHLEVDSPFGNAGGCVRTPGELEAMLRTGVGWSEGGSWTLDDRPGNDEKGTKVVYVHIPETGETYNSIGMKNKGADVVLRDDIPEMVRIARSIGKPLVANVAPVSSDPIPESIELVTRFYEAGVDAVLLNASCPNVVTADGGRHDILSSNPGALYNVLNALKGVTEKHKPVFVRITPQRTQEEAEATVRAIAAAGTVSAIFTPNTWPGRKPPADHQQLEVKGGVGGLSGPITADASAEQTAWIASSGAFDVVSSSGIMNGRELGRRLELDHDGYVKAGAGSTFFWESKDDWRYAVDRLLWELLAE